MFVIRFPRTRIIFRCRFWSTIASTTSRNGTFTGCPRPRLSVRPAIDTPIKKLCSGVKDGRDTIYEKTCTLAERTELLKVSKSLVEEKWT